MDSVKQSMVDLEASRMSSIPISGLISRSRIVYKWKTPFHCWMLREAVFWRLHDLLAQSYLLHTQGHGLGARILLRSGFETLAILIYLNQLMRQVLDGKLDFHLFGDKAYVLLRGSRDGSTDRQSLNIMTILEKCDKIYPGISKVYATFSESAHPNYEGLCVGYSKIDHNDYEVHFSNQWMEIYGETHARDMELCIETFQHEYNQVWADLILKLEGWVEANDAQLEESRSDNSQK